MSTLAFYGAAAQALEEIKAPHMIAEAFAGLAFGVSRGRRSRWSMSAGWVIGLQGAIKTSLCTARLAT
jgi:hypothetical protein